MGKCNQKPKFTCGDVRANARCVFYDLPVPSYSKLDEEECLTIEETTEDLYNLISWIRESVDLDEYDDECLNTEKVNDVYFKNKNRYLLKDVLKELVTKVCAIEEASGEGTDDTLSLDFKCLVSPCGEQITNLKDLLQVLINEICKLKNQ